MTKPIWLAAGVRTPFTKVDGGLAKRDAIALGVPVLQAMAEQVSGRIDAAAWGSVIPNLGYSNLARETWLEAKLDPTVPTFTVVMQCSTSMMAAFDLAGILGRGAFELALAGGAESMTHIQAGLTQPLSDWLRHLSQAKDWKQRAEVARDIPTHDIHLQLQSIKNRSTGKSMGEHSEETAKQWEIGRVDQDVQALESHQRAVAGQDRGFFKDLIVPVDGVDVDTFPRRNTSLEALGRLSPAFDRTSGHGTITAGNSSPLTDGAAAVWVATDVGLTRLPSSIPRARLVDFDFGAVDIQNEGLLMAPAYSIPRLLARNGLKYEDIALWEIHEAFSSQVLYQLKALDSAEFVKDKAKVDASLGTVPRERINPNGGSVALGHPFGATGARILSQAIKELSALPKGSRAIVSVCADGGVGTVALLEN
ncbi:3-ketoacyl-CoA thiolase [Labilithrix luteola]|uniref:3-ketoacyl-CoA thiolase n=1 Tax=Labilithrix luteola TaxID=1391654 RepID=A0A0K1QDU0_9BACT|nr:acetyl-CoA C-acyltransferase [Labilithrix luteola]AKV03888.1 3-ketoacyl-CoA thiolase [Labilithrix luteola]